MPLPFDPVWAVDGPSREPTPSEQNLGFPCGEADRTLFNGLFQDIQQAINAFDARNGNADIPVLGWQAAPPASPNTGDRYIVAASPTGAWAGQAHRIAIWLGAWIFVDPVVGLVVNYWGAGVPNLLMFNGTIWLNTQRSSVSLSYNPGTHSWIAPAGVTRVRVRMWGGGGGGGGTGGNPSAASGGGGGAYLEGWVSVTSGQSYTIIVGGGGSSGVGSNTGGGGGTTSAFGLTATGGGGGFAANGSIQNTVPPGGTASGGDFSVNAAGGGVGFNLGGVGFGGQGGYTFGTSTIYATGAGATPGGGGGGGNNGNNGGAGGAGRLILEY